MTVADRGQAAIEAVVLGVALFVPLVFGVVVATGVHRATLAADAAARDAARAFAIAPTAGEARQRAEAAGRQAAVDHGLSAGAVRIDVDGEVTPGGTVVVRATVSVPRIGIGAHITRRAVADVDRFRAAVSP